MAHAERAIHWWTRYGLNLLESGAGMMTQDYDPRDVAGIKHLKDHLAAFVSIARFLGASSEDVQKATQAVPFAK